MAAPTLITSGAVIADTATPYSCAPVSPAHAVSDIMISPVITTGAQAHTIAGTGWAVIGSAVVGTHRVSFGWKRATATTGEGPTWTASGGTGTMFSNTMVFRGCETSGNPWDSAATFGNATTDDTSPDAPSVTTLGAERFVVALIIGSANNVFTATGPWAFTDNSSSATSPGCRTVPVVQTIATAQTLAASQLGTIASVYRWAGLMVPLFPPGGAASDIPEQIQAPLQADPQIYGDYPGVGE